MLYLEASPHMSVKVMTPEQPPSKLLKLEEVRGGGGGGGGGDIPSNNLGPSCAL